MTSVRFTIGRSSEKGDLPVECVSEDVRDLQIEAEAGADDVLRFKLAFTVHAKPCCAERPVEDAPEVINPLNAIDDADGNIVRVQSWNGLLVGGHQDHSPVNHSVGTLNQYNQMPSWPSPPKKPGGPS